jgi:hypothetical protein
MTISILSELACPGQGAMTYFVVRRESHGIPAYDTCVFRCGAQNSDAIGGAANMPRICRAYQSDVNDPGCMKTNFPVRRQK